MCGIFGMVSLGGEPLRFPERLEAMGRALKHRGPDGCGVVRRPGVGLGRTRLRIIDLHERADPPSTDPGSRCWLLCNGEIYNTEALRRRYPDYPFRTRSDIEPILPLYLERGWRGLSDIDGMFAVAIWDEREHALVLARDRAGEKPLFYSRVEGELWFASEVQALLLHPTLSRELDETALRQYMALGYVPEPRTLFRDIHKVEAGTLLRITAERELKTRYWHPWDSALDARDEPKQAALIRLRTLLREAVRKQLAADVPMGVFLSGGVDSSLITAIAARQTPERGLHTFTARFSASSFDESPWAAGETRRLGTEHHEVVVDEGSMAEALAAVVANLAEPLADPAILPTYLLAREARRVGVKAILSGEGADELFGGYPTYLGHHFIPRLQALPAPLRRLLRGLVERLPPSRRKVTLELLLKKFFAGAEKPWLERHLAWFGAGAGKLLAKPGGAETGEPVLAVEEPHPGGARGAMLLDYRTYLPDNLLVKNDRATMMSSVEARAPFLDPEITAFAMALPERFKVRGTTTKWLLKKAAEEWLPHKVIYRKKRGLSVPVAQWLDAGLRPEVDRLLEPERLARQGLFDVRGVGDMLAEHRAQRANHAKPLWTLLMFQYWLETWVPGGAK